MGPLKEAQLDYSCVKFPPTLTSLFSILNVDKETRLTNLAKGNCLIQAQLSFIKGKNLLPKDLVFIFLTWSRKTKFGSF